MGLGPPYGNVVYVGNYAPMIVCLRGLLGLFALYRTFIGFIISQLRVGGC